MPLVGRRFSEACRDPFAWPELHVLYKSLPTKVRALSFLSWLAVRAPGLQMLVFGRDTVRDRFHYINADLS